MLQKCTFAAKQGNMCMSLISRYLFQHREVWFVL